MEIVKWIFVVAALAGMALALVELATEKPDTTTDSDRLPDGLAGTWERKTPDGRMEATIADGAIEVVRVSGDSREGRLRGEGPEMGGPRGPEGVPYGGYGVSRFHYGRHHIQHHHVGRDAWPPSRKGDRHAQ